MAAQCATESTHNPLWEFSLALYAKPGMQEILLRLQNEADMDVLMLLADRWLMATNRTWVREVDLADYLAWRNRVVLPLRTIRMSIERRCEPLRTQLLQAELSAEREGMNYLYRILSASSATFTVHLLDMPSVFLSQQKKEAAGPLFQQFIQAAN